MPTKIKKIALDRGHGCAPDNGAIGLIGEEEAIDLIADALITLFKKENIEVIETRPREANSVQSSLDARVQAANKSNADLFVSIHLNAFNGNAQGTEVFYYSESGQAYAQNVVREITNLGYLDRGAKKHGYYVLIHTSMPAILIEACFIDNSDDAKRFNPKTIAHAIMSGILNKKENLTRDISHFQEAINRICFDRLSVTGKADMLTQAAHDRFCEIMHIENADPKAIFQALDEIENRPILRPSMSTGYAVRYAQYKTKNPNIDGVYGEHSAAYVARWQKEFKLNDDGIVGAKTWETLLSEKMISQKMTTTGLEVLSPVVVSRIVDCSVSNVMVGLDRLKEALIEFNLTERFDLIGVLATCCVEVRGLTPIEEYASGEAYENRQDLGNVHPGDGKRYKGRGILQITGRANYRYYGRKLGIDLEETPEKAMATETSARILGLYFIERKVHLACRRQDWRAVRKLVNGGYNGWDTFIASVRRGLTEIS